ncbi:class E sortase [Streptomyces sp. NPDC014894]|uniref:class E sortase n=1 Tax=Streptomyces sp. NPDC014894 TaxID=3364931 RepID=UPI00370104D6
MSLRLVVRALSELCVTAGTVIVLFVVYAVFWTGVTAANAAEGEIDRLRAQWSQERAGSAAPAPPAPAAPHGPVEPTPPAAPAPAAERDVPADSARPSPQPSARPSRPPAKAPDPAAKRTYRDGEPFAVMRIPRFGRDWDWPVLEGTRADTLGRGLGHYRDTAALGAPGNFAVAGHRRTHGDPFKDFPALRRGDAIELTDGTTRFIYRVEKRPLRTVPTDVGVIDPVPEKSGFRGPGRYLTLTTCEPEWGSSHRLIVWARLETARPMAGD